MDFERFMCLCTRAGETLPLSLSCSSPTVHLPKFFQKKSETTTRSFLVFQYFDTL